MDTMMDGGACCGMPMMLGMGVAAIIVLGTLGVIAAAAIKYLRSGPR